MDIAEFISTYLSEGDKFSAISLSILIMGGYLGIALGFKDKLIKTVLILPPALIFIFFAYINDTGFSQEYYLNLGTMLLSALFAVIIVFFAETLESWLYTLLGLAAIALLLVFVTPSDSAQTSLYLNLAVGMMGAYLIALLLRQEWKWSPEGRDEELWKSRRQELKERDQGRTEIGDYHILITDEDEGGLKQRIDFLREHNLKILKTSPVEIDQFTGAMYQIVNAKIETVVKDPDTVFLDNQEARLQLLGYPNTVKRILDQMNEVFELEKPRRLEYHEPAMVNIETKAKSPEQLFSAYLEQSLVELARDWRGSDKEHLIMATDELVAWAEKMHFIK